MRTITRRSTRVLRESPALRTEVQEPLSRTQEPCALAAAGEIQPLAGGEHRTAGNCSACDISSGRSTGGLANEGIEAKPLSEAGGPGVGSSPSSCLFLARMGAGGRGRSAAPDLLPGLAFALPGA